MSKKLACAECGGTFFAKTMAEQFVSGGYGSAEFRSMSNSPKTVLHCIGCGTPVAPAPSYYSKGTVPFIAEQEFRQSIELGIKYKNEHKSIVAAPISDIPTKEELAEIRSSIEKLKKQKLPKNKQDSGLIEVNSASHL